MNEILSTAVALIVLAAAFAGLVAWVRRDAFTGGRRRTTALAGTDTVVREQEPVTVRRRSPAEPADRTGRRTRVLQVSGS